MRGSSWEGDSLVEDLKGEKKRRHVLIGFADAATAHGVVGGTLRGDGGGVSPA